MLGPDDRLPWRPRRVVVAGTSGSGKSTLAAALADVLGLPYVEIDALFHGPGWTPRPTFGAEVAAFTAQQSWVTEWQYDAARPLLAQRAEVLVWLDLPRRTVMRQVTARTLRRRLRRERLWNGNTEATLRTFFTDPEHIVRWAWTTHRRTRRRIVEAIGACPHLVVVRLRSRRDVRRWLKTVLDAGSPDGRAARPIGRKGP